MKKETFEPTSKSEKYAMTLYKPVYEGAGKEDDKRLIKEAQKEALQALKPYQDDQMLAVSIEGLLAENVIVMSAGELRKKVQNMDDSKKSLRNGHWHSVIVVKVDPAPDFEGKYHKKVIEGKKQFEKEFEQEMIEESITALKPYMDEHEVVYTTDSWTGRYPEVDTAGNLRKAIENYKDPENQITYGYPIRLGVLSGNPEEFLKERALKEMRYKEHYFNKLKNMIVLFELEEIAKKEKEEERKLSDKEKKEMEYTDDDTIWELLGQMHGNRKNEYRKTTVGEFKKMIEQYNFDDFVEISSMGGYHIIAGRDPEFNPKNWHDNSMDRKSQMYRESIEMVQIFFAARDELLKQIKTYPNNTMVEIIFANRPEVLKMTIEKCQHFIKEIWDINEFSREGTPIIVPVGEKH